MRIADRHFSPPFWAVILYLVVGLCMLWLGNWQLQRAKLKISMHNAAQIARNVTATDISEIANIDEAAASFTRVFVEGSYDGDRQLLWDNRIHRGQAGFEVIVPLRSASGLWVLVNRGWIAPGKSRALLPDVELPAQALGQTIRLEGFLSKPSQGFASGDALETTPLWPRILQYFDYDAISQALGEPIVPVVVQPQVLEVDAVASSVLTLRPEWLNANWQPAASGPARHYSYAFQWFAMAAALTVLFIVVNIRKVESR